VSEAKKQFTKPITEQKEYILKLKVKIRTCKEEKQMPIKPLYDRIVVKRIEEEEQKIGGIIIPDTAKEKPQEGEVIAVGAGRVLENGERQAPDVEVGDKILFGKYSGTEVKYGDEEYLIMREDDILAKIVKD
jgi:chaperonin GroES